MFKALTTTFFTLILATLARAADSDESSSYPAGFIPKKWPAYAGLIAYATLALIAWIHFFRTKRPTYLLVLPIGLTTMSLGFVIRFIYINSPDSVAIYANMSLFILLSPCAYLAATYILLKHLCYTVGPEATDRCLMFNVRWIVKFFVWSDVTTFLIQASGGGLSAIGGNAANIGEKISIVGLILQLVAFSSFTVIFILFNIRLRQQYPYLWHPSTTPTFSPLKFGPLSISTIPDIRPLFYLIYISCFGIIIRSVFRIVEFSQGYRGYIVTHEGYFWLFDALPLFIAMSGFTLLSWPERYFRGELHREGVEKMKEYNDNRMTLLKRLGIRRKNNGSPGMKLQRQTSDDSKESMV